MKKKESSKQLFRTSKRSNALFLAFVMVLGIFQNIGVFRANNAQAAERDDIIDLQQIPVYDLAPGVDSDAIRFNNLEWTGTNVTGEQPNPGPQNHVFEVNREKPHSSTTFAYESLDKALAGARDYKQDESKYYMALTTEKDLDPSTSDWKFSIVETLTKNLDTANNTKDPLGGNQNIVDFYKTDYNADNWNGIAVPSSWQVQGIKDGEPYTGYYDPEYGYTPPFYTNVSMPGSIRIEGRNRNIFSGVSIPGAPNDYNPVGFYRRHFDVPEEWIKNKNKVFISFDGVESVFYLYVNGKEVGYHTDSKTPGKFDLTPFLTADGKNNLIALKVYHWADSSWLEDQDFLRHAGVSRDIYLTATPYVHIRDYKVETTFDDSFTNATIDFRFNVKNYAATDLTGYNVTAQLFTPDDGTPSGNKDILKDYTIKAPVPGLNANEEVVVTGSTIVDEPHKWFPDDPYLYTLVLTITDSNNVAIEHISQQFGFRQVTYKDSNNRSDIIRINGKKVTMRGVNRHDNSPTTGRYISKEQYEEDLRILKRNNFNTIRTAHYPNDTYLYYLADKWGFMICAEANNESHAVGNTSVTPANFKPMAEDRVRNLMEKEKNRTSVIMWSLGNESGGGNDWRDILASVREVDRTRPMHYEGLGDQNANTATPDRNVDVHSVMYWGGPGAHQGNATNSNVGSAMLCEYSHAMGNASGNFKEYFDVFRSTPKSIGGCIWEYIDHSIWTKLPENASWDYFGNGMYLAYGGDWGEGNHDGSFCADGLLSANRNEYPEVTEIKKVQQSLNFEANDEDLQMGIVNARNEYYAKNGNEFELKWMLYEDGEMIHSDTLADEDVPSIPSMTTETILLNIPKIPIAIPYLEKLPVNPKPGAEYALKIQACLKEDEPWAPAGYPLSEEQFELTWFKPNEKAFADLEGAAPLTVNDDAARLTMNNNKFNVTFDKTTGLITNYEANGVTLLTSGPAPTFWRALMANDRMGSNEVGNWRLADQNKVLKSFEIPSVTPNNMFAEFTVTYALPTISDNTFVHMNYRVIATGAIRITTSLETDSTNQLYRFGADMTMPEGFEYIDWFAHGPKENLNDRLTGSFPQRFQTTVSDNYWPYAKPQDTGTRQGTRYMALTAEDKDMGLMLAATGERLFESNALHFNWRDMNDSNSWNGATSTSGHPYQLTPRNETIVGASYGSRGTGGASVDPPTLTQYRLPAGNMSYSYTLVPFDKAETDLGTLSSAYRDEITYRYTVTFNTSGGTLAAREDKKMVEPDNKIGNLPVPTRALYTFEGWFTAENGGGTQITRDTVVTNHMKVFAHWREAPYKRTVELIDAIGTVEYTSNCLQKINAARAAYNGLTPSQQAQVKALGKLQILQEGETRYDELAAQSVIGLINKIGKVTLTSKEAIESARKAYSALNTLQKALVGNTNLEKLTKAESDYAKAIADAIVDAELPKKGDKFTSGLTYKITKAPNSAKKGGVVQVVFVKSNKTLSNITIPPTVKNKQGIVFKVESIAKNAFKGNNKVTKVTIGKYVKEIQGGAFQKCPKLVNVTIGAGVTKIGKNAFNNNKSLKTIKIKSKKLKLSKIGKGAFKKLPKKVKIKAPTARLKKAYQKFLKK